MLEIFAQSDIEGRMCRQVVAGIGQARKGIAEAGAVVNVGGGIATPGQSEIATEIQSVALVMVEGRETSGQSKIGEAASDGAATFGDLVGISQMNLGPVGDAG